MSSRSPRPFRFLASASAIVDGRTLAENARRAEASGIDVLVIPDHLVEQLAPIPMLATAAAATDRLRICAFVFNNDLRHPAVLAQDLASVDVLSGGRLEVGIGAGWRKPEYDAIGVRLRSVPFTPDKVLDGLKGI
jgi:alkanesulfonate monooxygenase SsuD/methylene tetrahydromethanopterin reductase-like flavin-dependent oxidoreductase (luciferase family)